MKKLALVMALALSLLAFSACSSDDGTSGSGGDDTSATSSVSEPAA
ncbi:hypothetical protein [Candidatus Soleaferrea massiliensis]|nr:hypothetical protein [Candidatus Soleaferrea massiliensis]